ARRDRLHRRPAPPRGTRGQGAWRAGRPARGRSEGAQAHSLREGAQGARAVGAHRVEITAAARRDLKSLPADVQRRVNRTILALGDDPHPPRSSKLEGYPEFHRVRTGDYRVVVRVERGVLVVVIIAVAHRSDV